MYRLNALAHTAAAASGPPAGRKRTGGATIPGAIAESRALVAVAAASPGCRPGELAARPRASFLAHLIAARFQTPQTRARRRAAPGDVIGAYAARLPIRAAAHTRLARTV
jgi:hypothetical protein